MDAYSGIKVRSEYTFAYLIGESLGGRTNIYLAMNETYKDVYKFRMRFSKSDKRIEHLLYLEGDYRKEVENMNNSPEMFKSAKYLFKIVVSETDFKQLNIIVRGCINQFYSQFKRDKKLVTKKKPLNVTKAVTGSVKLKSKDRDLSFSEALVLLNKGKKISRTTWHDIVYISKVNSSKLRYNEPQIKAYQLDGGVTSWILNQKDILANDWFELKVVEE